MVLSKAIIMLLAAVLPLAGATIIFIAKFIKSAKGKKAAENLIKVTDAIEKPMLEAERISGYSGQQKKAYVMDGAKILAAKPDIGIDAGLAEKLIEKRMDFSKAVNEKHYPVEPDPARGIAKGDKK